ncbi:MAG: hypothetical protein ACYS30_21135 [Planctomycetota bacterium]|jgi:hypothetical protein
MSEAETKAEGQKPKTSKLAILSLISGIASFTVLFIIPLAGVVIKHYFRIANFNLTNPRIILPTVLSVSICSIIVGSIGLKKVGKSNGLISGKNIARAGLFISAPVLLCASLPLWVMFTFHGPDGRITKEVICGVNLSGLGKAMLLYANDYDDKYPTAEKWCDLLIAYVEVNPKQLVCKGSDAKIGESSYAMNKNVVGKKVTEIPEDVVVLFETNFGKNPAGRQGLLGNREWYKVLKSFGGRWDLKRLKKYRPSTRVHKLRWNKYGGPEILTTKNHKGKGCNILFNDSRVEFVKTERLGELKWKVEQNK